MPSQWHCISDTFRYQSGCDKISFNNKDSSSDNLLIKLVKAGLRTVTGAISKKNPQKVRFNTPTATISIRGTNFEVAVPEESKKDMLRRVLITKCSKARLILKQVPGVFFNGKYDNLLQALQEEAPNRLNSEIASKIPGGQIPSELKNLIPKLGDMFN